MRGPSPSATVSSSAKSAFPATKYSLWFAESPSMTPPALRMGPDGRTPGSTALKNEAMPICATTKNAAAADTSSDVEDILVFIALPPIGVNLTGCAGPWGKRRASGGFGANAGVGANGSDVEGPLSWVCLLGLTARLYTAPR